MLSGIFLFDDAPGLEVSLGAVIPIAVVLGAAVVLAGHFVVRARRRPPAGAGPATFVGHEVRVNRARGDHGTAFLEGAWWRLRSDGRDLQEGEQLRVVDVDGLELVVSPQPAAAPTDGRPEP